MYTPHLTAEEGHLHILYLELYKLGHVQIETCKWPSWKLLY